MAIIKSIPSLSYLLYTTFIDTRDPASASASPPAPSQVDANFWFFLIFYYGLYCAVALIYITQLFSLYRLNWWPKAVGARTSYAAFWIGSLAVGWIMHELDPLGTEDRRRNRAGKGKDKNGHGGNADDLPHRPPVPNPGGGSGDPWDRDIADEVQWQRKTMWVGLAFATMAMPALICFAGLRRSGRQTYRHSLTDLQKSELETSYYKIRRRDG